MCPRVAPRLVAPQSRRMQSRLENRLVVFVRCVDSTEYQRTAFVRISFLERALDCHCVRPLHASHVHHRLRWHPSRLGWCCRALHRSPQVLRIPGQLTPLCIRALHGIRLTQRLRRDGYPLVPWSSTQGIRFFMRSITARSLASEFDSAPTWVPPAHRSFARRPPSLQ